MTMNNQSPLIPQGSLLEQRNKGRARVKIAVFLVLAIHGVGLMALLMQGCKKEPDSGINNASTTQDASTNTPPAFVEPTNVPSTNISVATSNTVPTPPPESVPTASPATDYVIVKGDTFSTVAKKFHVSLKGLEDANPSVEPTKLKIGQMLHIPPATASTATNTGATAAVSSDSSAGQTYTVKSGDSLTKISGEYGVSVKAIRSANNLKTDKIVVGQKLKIPAKASATGGSNGPATTSAPTTTSGQ